MDSERFRTLLDSYEEARPWLQKLGLRHPKQGHANLLGMARQGITLDLLAATADQIETLLPACPDPDMALNNLDRYVAACRSPLSFASLLERDPHALGILVQLFSTSQHFSDLVIADPEYFEDLRLSGGRPVHPSQLLDQLRHEVEGLSDLRLVALALRRFRLLQMLRIGYGDIIRGQSLEVVTSQLSHLADYVVEASLQAARRRLEEKHGVPRSSGRDRARFVVLALGKLGGEELNYSSDIDLIFLYDEEGQTDGPAAISNSEFFGRLGTELVKLLAEHTERGHAYRVDLRLRPEGAKGPLARSLASTLRYYDILGRTWERQALIKARTIAGDRSLGEEFLRQIEPWIYRKYLSFAEIGEIKALKRRIEQQTSASGENLTDVKTGHGGIRDVEFAIQFLQLLNGGELPALRCTNTLQALDRLERVGCLTDQERHILEDNYRFLRKLEHRLQIMFDLQTHRLPQATGELRRLALRMGYDGATSTQNHRNQTSTPRPLSAANNVTVARNDLARSFAADFRQCTELNRKILDHLLHDAFTDEPGDSVEPEVDLILQPDPEPETVKRVLGRYPFQDIQAAFDHLSGLARESVPFLSSLRCRHFLASIAPRLLRSVATTPEPDRTLLNLEKVSESLGAKAVLWELLSFNPASLRLFVELCASSQFLVDILVGHPGMIDDLMDSLALNQPRTLQELQEELHHLCQGAEDPIPILHSFKNKELLRIGVRDILGKDAIEETSHNLTDLAESLLGQIARTEYDRLRHRLGTPTIGEGADAGQPCAMAILGLGKLGGREMTYHSDLDVVFVYKTDGTTAPPELSRVEPTTNFHFFSELGQRIIRTAGQSSVHGRLYEIDARLRPTGKSGSLSIPLPEFRRYYQSGDGQLWERQALTKARVIFGPAKFARQVEEAVANAAYGQPWQPHMADEILHMRRRMEASRSERNLKRGFGGLVDIEFLVQMLQLKYGREMPELRRTNTLEALDALHAHGVLSQSEHAALRDGHQFLRTVSSRLRMVHNVARDDLPEDRAALEQLARRLGYDQRGPERLPMPTGRMAADGENGALAFLQNYREHGTRTRELFLSLFARHGATRTTVDALPPWDVDETQNP